MPKPCVPAVRIIIFEVEARHRRTVIVNRVVMKLLMLVFSLLLSINLFAEDSDLHGNIVLTVDSFHNDKGIAI